ncbi:regulatory protein, LuxR [Desulforamulus reducens MI-1]|uniref:Regulatory protein, LuxR n=1 Tax=Desulforamulus reducens (strain ATCC BAA-1160 / DSM 100696 / MI-1) TaxID=349161 RepID=A4J715_DESRM|nr:helix-turn-helix transcriptional regulator [Desulforamulus reducens]ABO50868.1 regulatory protein, LuxR [Desulforamulus reducens MI-1]
MIRNKLKSILYMPQWVAHSASLILIFGWILIYPMHGFLLHYLFGSNAYLLGHVFTASHGLGLVALGLLPIYVLRNTLLVKLAGFAIFIFTFIWTILPVNSYIQYSICTLLGFISAYLVLIWACGFHFNKYPELTVGFAMAFTNIILGLVVFEYTQPETLPKVITSLTGLGPLFGAFYLARPKPIAEPQLILEEPGKNKTIMYTFLGIAILSSFAYFSGGLWYRAVLPLFYLKMPELIGIESFVYALSVLILAFFSNKYSFYWVGTIGLSMLGVGLATSISGLESSIEVTITLSFLAIGFGAIDLFYWLILRKLSTFLGYQKAFGLGLGLSLFFITAPGIAIDTGILKNPLLNPVLSIIGACLLFLINPLLVYLLRSLSLFSASEKILATLTDKLTATRDDQIPTAKLPEYFIRLTKAEKKVYDLICKGHTDVEIASSLFISRHTVKFHARNIFKKAGVSNRKELLANLSGNRDEDKRYPSGKC